MKTYHELHCKQCSQKILRLSGDLPSKKSWQGDSFCNRKCLALYLSRKQTLQCAWCGKEVIRQTSQIKKSHTGNVFCNKSCAASYNNTRKRRTTRSKAEKLLFNLLTEEFSNIEIQPNNKTLLNGYEADIAIPQLNLAIEWNGAIHFKPIYGQAKLDAIQQRDTEKQKIAQSKGINLIVVLDLVSNEKFVREVFENIKQIIYQLQRDRGESNPNLPAF